MKKIKKKKIKKLRYLTNQLQSLKNRQNRLELEKNKSLYKRKTNRFRKPTTLYDSGWMSVEFYAVGEDYGDGWIFHD